jgi:hypothetical protein
MSTVIDPNQLLLLKQGVRIGDINNANSEVDFGSIRYNISNNKFEGLHKLAGADIFGNVWRQFELEVASADTLGGIKIGTNLNINPSTAVLSSVAAGESRIYQHVITISPIIGAGDYQTIHEAIIHAIGTPSDVPPYSEGAITSNSGAPSYYNQYLLLLSPGQYTENNILPDFVSLYGDNNGCSFLTMDSSNISYETYGSIILCGDTSSIHDITFQINCSNSSIDASAIFSNNKSNIHIDAVKILDTSGIIANTVSAISFMGGGSNNSISNSNIQITNGINSNKTGINIYNTVVELNQNTITISNNGLYNKGVDIIASGYLFIRNTNITCNGGNDNIGVSNRSTNLDIEYSIIKCESTDFQTVSNVASIYGLATNPVCELTSTNI